MMVTLQQARVFALQQNNDSVKDFVVLGEVEQVCPVV